MILLTILQHAELIFGIRTDKNVTKNFKCTNKLSDLPQGYSTAVLDP